MSNIDERSTKKYRFYLSVNNMSLMLVFLLPLMAASSFIIIDIPYACDTSNIFLSFILIFAMNMINFKQSLEIFEKYDMFKEEASES